SYSTRGANPGDLLTLAYQPPSTATTGRYAWKVEATTPAGTKTVTGGAFAVNQESSTLGAGWTLAPVNQLVDIPADVPHGLLAGKLIVYGTGEYRFYTGTS